MTTCARALARARGCETSCCVAGWLRQVLEAAEVQVEVVLRSRELYYVYEHYRRLGKLVGVVQTLREAKGLVSECEHRLSAVRCGRERGAGGEFIYAAGALQGRMDD